MNNLLRSSAALLWLAGTLLVQGQQPNPRIACVYPAGGKQGTTFQVAIQGQYLGEISRVYVSGTGVEAQVILTQKPPKKNEIDDLRKRLAEVRKQPPSPEKRTEMIQIVTRMEMFRKRKDLPAFADRATLEVTIAPDAEPGERELRVLAPMGLSNPMVFCVGQFPEFSHAAVTEEIEPEKFREFRRADEVVAAPLEPEVNISIPAVLNGQLQQGGRDRYRFTARRGQRLVADVSARALIPYLADAVPGWFQATLTLTDGKGREVAYDDDYRFHPDPVLFCEIPEDGEYVLEVKDAIFRGRDDFVYRITLGELPFITGIFPLGCMAGTQTGLEVQGWNLATKRLTVSADPADSGIRNISLVERGLRSNTVPFLVDKVPGTAEREPNNSPEKPQEIVPPIVINGRIDKRDDRDVYKFAGKAGDVIVAEVEGRRLDSPVDSFLTLTGGDGKQIALNDDHEDKGSGLNTHHADSYLTGTLPATGTYFVQITDTQHNGGPEFAYRLRVSPPQPDFELRAVPSTLNVRGGSTAAVTIYALRRDDFDGPIAVRLKDSPSGVKLSGSNVPGNSDQVKMTVSVPRDAPEEPFAISLIGSGTIAGKEAIRPVVPADDLMQAFAYRHLVTAKELKVAVADRFRGRGMLQLVTKPPLLIPSGTTASVQVSTQMENFLERMQLELTEAPDGITMQEVRPLKGGFEVVLLADTEKIVPGVKGNLIVSIFSAPPQKEAEKPRRAMRRIQMGMLPAISFEILNADGSRVSSPTPSPSPASTGTSAATSAGTSGTTPASAAPSPGSVPAVQATPAATPVPAKS